MTRKEKKIKKGGEEGENEGTGKLSSVRLDDSRLCSDTCSSWGENVHGGNLPRDHDPVPGGFALGKTVRDGEGQRGTSPSRVSSFGEGGFVIIAEKG